MTAILYDLIYSIPLTIGTILMTHELTGFEELSAPVYMAAILCCLLLTLLRHADMRGRIILTGGVLALLAGTMLVLKTEFLKDNLHFLWILLIAAPAYFIALLASRYEPVRIITGMLSLTILVTLMVMEAKVQRGVFLSFFFYLSVSVAEWIQGRWKKEGYTDRKKHIVWMCPFLLLPFLIALTIPVKSKPYDWRFFKNLLNEARIRYEIIVQTFAPEQGWDSDTNMGFSDRAEINGKVEGDPYETMIVHSDRDNDYRLYLGGKIFDTFDGRQWVKTDESAMDYKALDRIETIAAILRYDPEHIDNYIRSVFLSITYRGMRTSHVFMPPKSYPDALANPMTQEGGDLILTDGKNGDYSLRYDRLNRDNRQFRDMLKRSGDFDEISWRTAAGQYGGARKEQLSLEAYRDYRERIVRYYGQKVVLSERAQKFTDELLAGAEDDFTKLERIEHYLSKCTYNRVPGELPDYVDSPADFVDYLLFEKSEGFCTHYATLLVLLARSQGIPARFVQGYSALTSTRDFKIMSDRAHAWPEAYLEGFGWLTFEPTPGYRKATGWRLTGEAGELYTGYVYESEAPVVKAQADAEGSADGIEPGDEALSGEIGDPDRAGIRWRWIVIPLLCAAAFVILFLIADGIFKRIRYLGMDERDKIVTESRRNLKTLRLLGLKIADGETLREFKVRAEDALRSGDLTEPAQLFEFIDIYEQVLYGAPDAVRPVQVEQCGRMIRKCVFRELCRKITFTGVRRR